MVSHVQFVFIPIVSLVGVAERGEHGLLGFLSVTSVNLVGLSQSISFSPFVVGDMGRSPWLPDPGTVLIFAGLRETLICRQLPVESLKLSCVYKAHRLIRFTGQAPFKR